jgi:catechol 2,3-dioxygenase-like lactoylglutathione lyase family enzyme
MRLRQGDPWMPARDYSRSLRGLTVNLLVRDIERALVFQREVLGAVVVYSDPDFAVLSANGAEWSLHADHAYDRHPLGKLPEGDRGVGAELRLHGRDPDEAEAAARRLGFTLVAPAQDKPHGLRETHVADPDGYVWVADVVSADNSGRAEGKL